MRQLTGHDASFVYLESASNPMHVGSISIYDRSTAPAGTVTFADIQAHVANCLSAAPTFRRKLLPVPLDLDHPYWVDDPQFDLEFHLRNVALPRPGNWQQLCRLAGRLLSYPLDRARPLWEMYVIDGLDAINGVPPGSFALLQKTHHAAVDGISGMEMMSAIHSATPEAPVPGAAVDTRTVESAASRPDLLGRAAANGMLRPMHFARIVGRTVPAFGRMIDQVRRRTIQMPARSSAPRTRFNANVTQHRVFDARRFELHRVREMKRGVSGATVNDVALAVVGGALREYLLDKGELPTSTLRAIAPISTRSPDGSGTQGNQVSAMVVDLATHIADPVDRLAAVTASTHQSKEFANAVRARR